MQTDLEHESGIIRQNHELTGYAKVGYMAFLEKDGCQRGGVGTAIAPLIYPIAI